MNKLGKVLAVLSIATVATAGAVTMAACNTNDDDKPKTGEAYGLVHSAGYVGYASVTVDGDKVTDASLSEVCLPTHVTAGDSVDAADKVTVTVDDHGTPTQKSYYKTVSYGTVTLTYDETDGYKVGDALLKDYFKVEANAKAYYDAVVSNSVSVTVGTDKKTDVMNKASLSKEENGYWSVETNVGNSILEGDYKWKANRDATVKYVKDNGVANLLKLEKNGDGYWADGTVSTGATWTDMNTTKAGTLSYARLIVNAYVNAGGEYTLDGAYSYTTQYGDYGVKVHVTVKEGKITKVTYDADTEDMHNITPSWKGHDVTAAAVDTYLAKFVGKTVAEVRALEVTTNAGGVPQTATWIFDGLTYEDENKDPSTVETGATQTSGRFILAIQNAVNGL